MIIACFLLFAVVQFEESQKSEEGFWRSLASALEGKYHVTNMEYMDVTQMSVSEQAYQKLPNRLKKAYRQLDEYVYKFYDNIDDIVIPKDDFQKVLSYYRADHPQAFWVSSAYRYQYDARTDNLSRATLSFSYPDPETRKEKRISRSKAEKMAREVQEKAELILSGITEEMTDYDKVLYLHDYLASTVAYDDTAPYQHTVYGALVEEKAVCDGYTSAMQYLLLQAGLDSQIAYGYDKADTSQQHVWNVVKIENEYYHLDITWDLPPEGGTVPVYANFLLTTEQVEKRHKILSPIEGREEEGKEDSIYPPIADCTDGSLNYYLQNGCYITDLSDDSVANILLKTNIALIEGEEQVQFLFESSYDLNRFLNEVEENVPRVARAFPYSCEQYDTSMITYVEDNILVLQFRYH